MIVLILIIIYVILNTGTFYTVLNQDKKVEKHIEKVIQTNLVINYISENDIKKDINSNSKFGFFSKEELDFVNLYLMFPLFLLIPIYGQYLIGNMFYTIQKDKKYFSDEYIKNLCLSKFVETLNNSYYNIGRDLETIKLYTSKANVNIIKDFLSEIKNPYYTLAFKNFETLLTIIKESKEQLKFHTENTGIVQSKIVNIINEYVIFINEINNKIANSLETNTIDKYSELLKSIIEDIKTGKY